MENRERTYQFYWRMSLERCTKQLSRSDLQSDHMSLCQDYRKSRTIRDADAAMVAIKAWWFSSGAALEAGVKELNNWINFWHFCYHQWGSHISQVRTVIEFGTKWG
jgi:hypothetical protein